MLRSRNLNIINQFNENKWITKNKTIIDYILEYSNQQKTIEAINYTRLCKRIILSCELVGFLGMN